MAMYIMLINWTEQGVKGVSESPRRSRAFAAMAEELGCTVHGIFFTMGRYDITARVSAPDDETVSALALKVARLGNVRTETLRAYTEEEFAKIVEKVGD